MFIFDRPFTPVAAGLGVVLLMVAMERCTEIAAAASAGEQPPAASAALVSAGPHAVSSAPVRDLSLSCRLPPASIASRLPSLKSRIVPDQVAVRAPTIHNLFGQHSC